MLVNRPAVHYIHQLNKRTMTSVQIEIRLRSSEKECPRCQHILVLNEAEECIECHYCGYIDCGDDEEEPIPNKKQQPQK